MWHPIQIEELYSDIAEAENRLTGSAADLWKLICIKPEKWKGKNGDEGGGFWVVAIAAHKVIWYNDIEEGFNISPYHQYGLIDEYWCSQLNLDEVVAILLEGNSITKNPALASRAL